MGHKTVRDIERQANLQAGVEKEGSALAESARRTAMEHEELTYSSIARALANRYDSIYYVNIVNNHYIEYISSSEYQDMKVEISGDDFFADSARNIRRVVHPEDQAFALMVHRKEYILAELEKEPLISVTYRLMIDGIPHYYNGRMTRAGEEDRDHLIVGWANVDAEINREKEFEEAKSANKLAKNINRALTSDYVKVFYVDLENDHFIESTNDDGHEELTVTASGENFFGHFAENAVQMVYKEDLTRFLTAFRKDHILGLMQDAPFILTYRIRLNGRLLWHTVKALYADDNTHMLVAIRNIDVQKRRETEYENKLHAMSIEVNRDALTSVKNRNAFNQEESMWNQTLAHGETSQFAVVVCDVNDLKIVNDTLGHQAGDEVIIAAARLISDIFKRSPVFRIGGDEFAVVLQEHDYESRSMLMGELEDTVRENQKNGGVVIASGMASFEEKRDVTFRDVFNRADAIMYEKKRSLKEG